MACFALIYGYIEGLTNDFSEGSAETSHAGEHNLRALQTIPEIDSEYPFLSRHMFALALPGLQDNYLRGIIRQIIHFGASLKCDSQDLGFADQWLAKFQEVVLPRFVWRTAVVHFIHENAGERIDHFSSCHDSLRAVREELGETGQWIVRRLQWNHKRGNFPSR